MGLFGGFGKGGGIISRETAKDFFDLSSQTNPLGPADSAYSGSKDRKEAKAIAAAEQNEAAITQAKSDAQGAANRSIIDARRRKRAQSLVTSGTPLGGVQTALGSAGGVAAQPLGASAMAYGGF